MFTIKTERMKMTAEAIARHNEQKRQRYLANRDSILALAAARRRAAKVLGITNSKPTYHPVNDITNGEDCTEACMPNPDMVEDTRTPIERDRREVMEGIRLRLIWASSAGGDEGTVAQTAVSVIRFAEGEGRRWTDRGLRDLHRRLSLASGLTPARFDAARETLAKELFVPL